MGIDIPEGQPATTRRVGDRYELLDLIGRGAAARVYRARDTLLHREVAVKMLTEEAAADPAFVERFRREAKAVASINHPNIVTVYDWGTTGDVDYMVMEYVPGGSLSELLVGRHRLDEEEALQLAAGIARALAAAHQRGIVHRDIKPGNILLGSDRHPTVADFGIAWAQGLSHLTLTNAICGTVSYISPEQARGDIVDGRSDLYSLGIVLYQMVTGRLPFRGASMVDVAIQHVQNTPTPPGELRPDLSPATADIITRALEKQPERRFASAQAMAQALDADRASLAAQTVVEPIPGEVTNNEPLSASGGMVREKARRGAAPIRPVSPITDRRTWLLALFPALLLFLVAGAVLAQHPWSSGTPRAAPTTRPAASTGTNTPHPTAAPAKPGTPQLSGPAAGSSSPADAVIQFYTAIGNHQFAAAAHLWSPSLRERDPPSEFIDHRFAQTQSIWVDHVTVTNQAPSGDTATVGVHVTQILTTGETREYTGTWQLVRQNGVWLLNQPNLQLVPPTPSAGHGEKPKHGKGPGKAHHGHKAK